MTITYTPTSNGSFSFDLDIPSDDSDEATYDIALSGTASANPEINVKDDKGTSVADGGTLAVSPNPVGGSSTTEILTIENTGSTTLTLGTPTTSNTSNATVASAVLGTGTVAAGGSTTLTITYTPTDIGAFSFDLDIPSDDGDEANYDIALNGTADTSGPSVSDAAIRVQQAGSQVTNSTFAKSIARTVQNRFHQARGGRGRVFSNNLSQFSNQTAMHGATPRLSSEVNAPVGSLGEAFGQIGERLGFYDGDGWTSFTTDDLFMAAGNFSSFQSLAQVEQLEADFGAGLSSFGRTSPFGALLPGDGLDFYGSYSGGHYYRKGLDAYEGFSSELTVGLDGFFTDDLFAGLALAHEASRVDFTGTSQGRLVKEGVRTDVYGAWRAFEAISLEGLASYGRFGNKVTTLGETGKPDSERWIISGRANLDLNWDRYLVTPNASLTYITETYDAYATDLGTAVASQKIDSGSWSTGVRVQGFEPIIYGLNGYLSANAEGTWETSNTTSLSNGYGTNAMTGAWEAGLTGSMAGFADGTWLGDILTTADTTIRYSQSGLFGPDLSSNWSIGLRWNF